jgi:hypothetical protein
VDKNMKNIKIFIDNTGHEQDKKFGNELKERLLNLRIDANFDVKTFSDLEMNHDKDDPNNEKNTIQAIQESSIVIPVISSSYVNYITPEIEEAINGVIYSDDCYLFPILLNIADWSNHDWVVKSQITPKNAQPFLFLNENERETILNEFIKDIKSAILNVANGKKSKHTKLSKYKNTVFISHDHDDADFAELLKLKLEKEGIDSWLDTERLKIGQDWREEIDQGIEESIAVIAVMTPEARKSEYVTYEWAFAWGKGKKIFPIMLKMTQLHPRLESLQYLNFTNHSTRPWDELIDSIKKAME